MNAPSSTDLTAAPLLLLPGTLCDGEVFAPLTAALSASGGRKREITVGSLSGGDLVSQVARRLLSEAPDRFILVGFSLGGIVAIEIASIAPERVLGLALIDSNCRALPEARRASVRAEADAATTDLESYLLDVLWPRYVARSALEDEGLKRTVLGMARRIGLAAFRSQTQMALTRPCSRARLANLAMPSLVLAGLEDQLCPPEVQVEMAQALPNARLVLMPDAGHFAILEKPSEAAAHVLEWLEDIERRDLAARGCSSGAE